MGFAAAFTPDVEGRPSMPPERNGSFHGGAGDRGPSGPGTYWQGRRLVDSRVSDGDRLLVLGMHAWWLFGIFLPPMLLLPVLAWAMRQSDSGFVDDHGRELINLQLNAVVVAFIPPLWPLLLVWAINSIRAMTATGRREYFRYPAMVRVLS
jgi:hypothetical protein